MDARRLSISPPVLNSASLWASTESELRVLYESAYTGAITTRTSLLNGFEHDDGIHKHVIFETSDTPNSDKADPHLASSLNTLGYSPHPLQFYVDVTRKIELSIGPGGKTKPVIFSVTGTPSDVSACFDLLSSSRPVKRMLVEVNLSCPNIPGKPPPAYSRTELATYVATIAACTERDDSIPIGLKLPPYTHAAQFEDFISALRAQGANSGGIDKSPCPVAFVTAVNTLGCSLLMTTHATSPHTGPVPVPALDGPSGGIGGLAGVALHPLALGNVRTLRVMLDAHPSLAGISIIGVGGVNGAMGYQRMRAAGADFVGLATALGLQGPQVFANIADGT